MSRLSRDEEFTSSHAFRTPTWWGARTKDDLTVDDLFDPEFGDMPEDVVLRPMYDATGEHVDDYRLTTAVWADGRERTIAPVGKNYVPVGPRTGLDAWQQLVEEGTLDLHGGVALLNYRRVLLNVGLPDKFVVDPGGIERPRSLVGNVSMGNDGESGITFAISPLDWVCLNTEAVGLRWAQQHKRYFTLHHRARVDDRLDEVRMALAHGRDYMFAHTAASTMMARAPMSDGAWEMFRDAFLAKNPADGAPAYVKDRAEKKRDAIDRIYRGHGVDGQRSANGDVTGTVLGAFTAFTEYCDWFRPTQEDDAEADAAKRAEHVLTGTYVKDKTDVFNRLAVLAAEHHTGKPNVGKALAYAGA